MIKLLKLGIRQVLLIGIIFSAINLFLIYRDKKLTNDNYSEDRQAYIEKKIDHYKKSLVILLAPNNTTGTGFILKNPYGKLVVISNAHVCMADYYKDGYVGNVFLKLSGYNSRFYNKKLKVIKIDIKNDLCELEMDNQNYPYYLDYSDKISKKLLLITYHPSNYSFYAEVTENDFFLDNKRVGFNFHEDSKKLFLNVIPGMSGSPVLNSNGKVVYVIYGKNKVIYKLSYAVGNVAFLNFLY